MVYQWRFSMGIPAQEAGEELERIEREHGNITPELVLDASREESAPLHECFEWDNDVAAEKYRISQAGHIIQNLIVTNIEGHNTPPVRAFVNVGTKQKGEFVGISIAMQNAETRDYVLENAIRELESFRRKYRHLSELADVFAALDRMTA